MKILIVVLALLILLTVVRYVPYSTGLYIKGTAAPCLKAEYEEVNIHGVMPYFKNWDFSRIENIESKLQKPWSSCNNLYKIKKYVL